jgi:hypothetical protein
MGQGALTNVVAVDIEPDYGYVARLTYMDGAHRITYGNDLGLNAAAACDLAKDKGHTKFMLRTIGVNCPKGEEFLLPWWHEKIGPAQAARGNTNIKTVAQTPDYIDQELGYPVYVKPVDGSKGADIHVPRNRAELEEIFEIYEKKRVRVALVEEPVRMPDYRIVCLDGELISAYRRLPLAVIGDGSSNIRQLLENLQRQYEAEGRDTRLDINDPHVQRYMVQHGLGADTIPGAGQPVALASISNLSAGGTSKDVSDVINDNWVSLAARVAENFNLRLVGVDLACNDITSADADYSVLEVNASPGLDNYAASGEAQRGVVDGLYTKVLNAFPGR